MPTTLLDLAKRFDVLFDAWERAGRQLYLVGGCVRDVLMQADVIGDIDLATDALPDETTELLRGIGFPAYPIGARFGTISTIVDGSPIEITTFRVEEEYETGSRKPHVKFGTELRHDLSRRDLSLNAMAAGRGGVLHDPFDGQGAIAAQILEVPAGGFENTVGILRDDPLRLLRIARFAARFGFAPTPDTTAAAKITSAELEVISHERWKMELDKTLVASSLRHGILWLDEVGALTVILPQLAQCGTPSLDEDEVGGVPPFRSLGESLANALDRTSVDRITRWAVMFYAGASCQEGFGLPSTDAVPQVDGAKAGEFARSAAKHFRFSNEELTVVRALCSDVMPASRFDAPWSRKELRRFLAQWGGLYQPAIDLSFAWSRAPQAAHARLSAQLLRAFHEEDYTPVLPSGFGRVVLHELGLPRGPLIAKALDYLRAAIVDGDVANGADAQTYLEFLRERVPVLESSAGEEG